MHYFDAEAGIASYFGEKPESSSIPFLSVVVRGLGRQRTRIIFGSWVLCCLMPTQQILSKYFSDTLG
jgi:hypothetical protein